MKAVTVQHGGAAPEQYEVDPGWEHAGHADEAARILREELVIDALGGHIVAPEPPVRGGRTFLDRSRDVGITVASVTMAAHVDSFDLMLRHMFEYLCLLDHQRATTLRISTVADIHRARREGRLGILFGAQTGGHVGPDVWRWSIAHALGLRICAIAYNERNALGDGCLEPENRGLTAFGRQAVQEMNRLGIVVDISHTGERTSLDAISYSAKPVVATHSNAFALTPSRRNLRDEVMRAVAGTGGVVGISPFSAMCWRQPDLRPTVDDYLNHLEYAVELLGVDHVGIGSDIYESYTKLSWESSTKRLYPTPWYWETRYSAGFDRVEGWTAVVAGLLGRGFSRDDVRAVLGGNWLRVFEQVWADADGVVSPSDSGWMGNPYGVLAALTPDGAVTLSPDRSPASDGNLPTVGL